MADFNPFDDKSGGFERELIPEGPHAARCARIIELGRQYSPKFDASPDDAKEKVAVSFAIPGVTMEINGEEKQRFIGNPYGITKSSFERSTMRQYARALCPDGGSSLGDFLNKSCQVYVTHVKKDDKTYDRLDAVAPLLPGIEVPELDMPTLWFKWNQPDPEVWVQIPEFQQNMIKDAVNYPGSYVEEMVNGLESSSDDLPM